jgi:hypothetical protein
VTPQTAPRRRLVGGERADENGDAPISARRSAQTTPPPPAGTGSRETIPIGAKEYFSKAAAKAAMAGAGIAPARIAQTSGPPLMSVGEEPV